MNQKIELSPIDSTENFGDRPVAMPLDDDETETTRLLPDSTASSKHEEPQEELRGRQLFFYRTRRVLGFLLANWYKFVILGIVIALIVLVSIHGFSIFGTILAWFKNRNGWGGWGVYVGFYTAIVALYFPGVVFIMGAGFVFGFWRGLLAVWIGGAIGQALGFLLARYLLRDWVESFVHQKWKKWKYIDAAIEHDGWKLVLIMRLSPIIPYNLLNIAMATTSMHFWSFSIVSAIGIVFECGIFCYIGTIADSITSIVSGQTGKPKAVQWVLLGLSITMGVIGAFFVSFMVRRAIRKAEELSALDDDRVSSPIPRLHTLSPERLLFSKPSSVNDEMDSDNDMERGQRVTKFKSSPRTLSVDSLDSEPTGQLSAKSNRRKSRTEEFY